MNDSIKQMKTEKQELEEEINHLLLRFSVNNDVMISDISLTHLQGMYSGKLVQYFTEIEIKI